MQVSPIFAQFNNFQRVSGIPKAQEPCELVQDFFKTFELPDEITNHARFDEKMAAKIASYKDKAIAPVISALNAANDEKEITAGLFLLNRIIDAGAKSVGAQYHAISRFNYDESPNVQVMLAGIYRKTQVPDGFGPLMGMFLKNTMNPVKNVPFDPNEEVGGAILEYLRNKTAQEVYATA